MLPENAKILLQSLSVFVGGWTVGDLVKTGIEGQEPEEVLQILVEASLVQRDGDRYRLSETVRQFAAERLAEGPRERAVRDLHLTNYLGLLSPVEFYIKKLGPDRMAEIYKPELDNVRQALAWSLSDNQSVAPLMASCAALAFSVVQLDNEAADWLQRALALDERSRLPEARIMALRRACRFYSSPHAHLDRATAAANTLAACTELKKLATENGDQLALAEAYRVEGSLQLDSKSAKACLLCSLEINNTLPDGGLSHLVLRQLGFYAQNDGKFEEARDLFERARQQAGQVGDTGAAIDLFQASSLLLREQCDYKGALKHLAAAESIASKWGDARALAFIHLRVAEVHMESLDFEKVAEPLGKARAFYQESRSRFHEMLVDGMERYIWAHEGRVSDAANGISAVTAKLVQGAAGSPWAWWHAAGIELEALSLALAKSGHFSTAALLFGAAKSIRKRDAARLSDSVLHRWICLEREASIGAFVSQTEQGERLPPEETLEIIEKVERNLMAESSDYRYPGSLQS